MPPDSKPVKFHEEPSPSPESFFLRHRSPWGPRTSPWAEGLHPDPPAGAKRHPACSAPVPKGTKMDTMAFHQPAFAGLIVSLG